MGDVCERCGAPVYVVASGMDWRIIACTWCSWRKRVKM